MFILKINSHMSFILNNSSCSLYKSMKKDKIDHQSTRKLRSTINNDQGDWNSNINQVLFRRKKKVFNMITSGYYILT